MPPPQLPLEILLDIAGLLTNNKSELCFSNFNSFLKVNRVLYACLNRTLWQEASKSQCRNSLVFTHLIRTNDLASLKFYLELGADVETFLTEFDDSFDKSIDSEMGDKTETPLKAAVALDKVLMVRLLLEYGADVTRYDEFDHPDHSAIHVARSAEMVELLLDYGADPEHLVAGKFRPLHYYAIRGNIGAIQAVLRYGVEVDPAWFDPVEGCLYPTPLHYAAWSNTDAVKLLLNHGADVRKKVGFEETPFHSAAVTGQTDTLRLLHEHWPEGTREGDGAGRTPLHRAAGMGQIDAVRVLLKLWPDGIREKNKEGTPCISGDTPLHSAAAAGNTEVVRLLVEAWPGGMREKNKNGNRPLHLAARTGKTEVVRLLVQSWPQGVREKNKYGHDPWYLADRKTEVGRLLMESRHDGI